MEKAFGYIRVSGKGQLDGDGFERQRQAIEAYAKEHKIEVVEIFEEKGISGTLKNRPALAQMLVALKNNQEGVKTVIIEKVDRLARDLMVQETILADMSKIDITVLSAVEGDVLKDGDPTRKLIRQVLGAIAEYDKEMTVQKLRAARERKRAVEGKCEGGKGYAETQPEVVAEVKRLKRKRKGRKQRTSKQIAEHLNEMGYRTTFGAEFNGRTIENIMYASKRSKADRAKRKAGAVSGGGSSKKSAGSATI